MLEAIVKIGTSAAAVVGLGLGIKAAVTDRKQNRVADDVKKHVIDNKHRIDALDSRMASMDDRLENIDKNLEVLRGSIDDLTTRAKESDNAISALVRYLNIQSGTPVAPVPPTNGDGGYKVEPKAEAKQKDNKKKTTAATVNTAAAPAAAMAV